MKILLMSLWPFLLLADSRRVFVSQLVVKEMTLSTVNLPLGGLPKNSMASTTDHPNINVTVTVDVKSSNQSSNVIKLLFSESSEV